MSSNAVTPPHTCRTLSSLKRDAADSLSPSCWTRNFAVNPLYLLGGLIVIVVYVLLPIYLYTSKLTVACCELDLGTRTQCDAVHSTHSTHSTQQGDAPVMAYIV